MWSFGTNENQFRELYFLMIVLIVKLWTLELT